MIVKSMVTQSTASRKKKSQAVTIPAGYGIQPSPGAKQQGKLVPPTRINMEG